MLNFDENLFFTKDFQVYSSSQQSEIEKLNAQEIDFQCFPEGGSLIDGLESRVAFKAVDASGKGIDIVGELVSSEGDTLLNFKSEHLGMGFFKFKPEAGKIYQAVVKYQNIFHQSFNLPPTQKEGFSMIIDNISSKTAIKVILASNLPNTEMQIIGQSKGVAFYAGKVPAGKQSAFISIPKDKFPPGVAQFTIFDENLRPRCERVIFIQPTTELSFSIKPDKSIYRTREKTTLEIEVKDNLGNPVEGNFSMSVLDEKQIKEGGNAETILTNLLLSSDLKGNIEQPTYYFDKTQRSANYHLDILLMTQGWRRFTWEKILQPKLAPPRFLLERGLTIDGQVLRQNDKPFDKQVNLTLVLGRDSTQQYLVSEAEKNGSFLLYGLSFADSCEVTIQATIDDENANAKIALTAQTLPKIPLVSKKLGVVEVEYRNLVDYLKYTKDALELQRKLKLDDAIMLNDRTSTPSVVFTLARNVPCLPASSSRSNTGFNPRCGCERKVRTSRRPVFAAPSTTTGCPYQGRLANRCRTYARASGRIDTVKNHHAVNDRNVQPRVARSPNSATAVTPIRLIVVPVVALRNSSGVLFAAAEYKPSAA